MQPTSGHQARNAADRAAGLRRERAVSRTNSLTERPAAARLRICPASAVRLSSIEPCGRRYLHICPRICRGCFWTTVLRGNFRCVPSISGPRCCSSLSGFFSSPAGSPEPKTDRLIGPPSRHGRSCGVSRVQHHCRREREALAYIGRKHSSFPNHRSGNQPAAPSRRVHSAKLEECRSDGVDLVPG